MRFLRMFVAAVLFASLTVQAHAEEFRLYGAKRIVRKHTTQEIPSVGKEFLRTKFGRATYYGAIACSEAGQCAYTRGYHVLDSAVDHAMAFCRTNLKPGDNPCTLFVTVVPKGYVEGTGRTLNWMGTKHYRDFQNTIGTAAVAVSDEGNWYVSPAENLEEAKVDALRRCNVEVDEKKTEGLKPYWCKILLERDDW